MAESLRILGVGDAKSRHFARWATRLAERGHEVHIASSRVNPREGELDGLQVHQFQDLDLLSRVPLVRRYRFAPALARLAQRVRPDVVHSHYLLPYGYWTERAGLEPLVVSPWGKDAIVDAWNSSEAEERARVAIAPERALAFKCAAIHDFHRPQRTRETAGQPDFAICTATDHAQNFVIWN